jgi:RNA polymerase sigma factor (sigma-70 family)
MRTIEEANRIVEENLGLAKFIVKTQYDWMVRRYRMDLEDVVAIAHVGLIRASRRWDGSKSKFSYFAFMCIKSEFARVTLRLNNDRREGDRKPRKLPEMTRRGEEVLAHPGPDPRDAMEVAEQNAHMVEIAMKNLDIRERHVLYSRVVDGQRLRDLSDHLGLSIEGIRLIERRAKEKCRAALATCTQTTCTQATRTQAA